MNKWNKVFMSRTKGQQAGLEIKEFATEPNDVSSIPESTSWEERPNSHRLSSYLYLNAMVHI